jgi:hypothetical protein
MSRILGRHGKARGSLASPVSLPHHLIGGLNVAAKTIGIEQWAGEPMVRELAPDRLE